MEKNMENVHTDFMVWRVEGLGILWLLLDISLELDLYLRCFPPGLPIALYCIFYRILFDNSEQCTNWYNRLSKFICPVSRLEDLFAFAFYAWCLDYNSAEKDEFTSFCEQGKCKAEFCQSGEFFCGRQM